MLGQDFFYAPILSPVPPILFLHVPHHSTGGYLQEASTNGGCRYCRCQTESPSHGGTVLANLNTHFQLSIGDPWDKQSQMGVVGKLPSWLCQTPYGRPTHLLTVCPIFTHINILQQEDQAQAEVQPTISWLQYIQYTANLLLLRTHHYPPNASSAFPSPSHCWQLVPLASCFMNPLGPYPPSQKLQNLLLSNL